MKVKRYSWDELKPSDKKMLPSFSIPLQAIPEAKKWKIGETYCVELDIVMKALDEKEARFEIKEVYVKEDDKEENETDE